MLRLLPLFFVACSSLPDRCLDFDITVVNASGGQVRFLIERAADTWPEWSAEKQGNIIHVSRYYLTRTAAEPLSDGEVKRTTFCTWPEDEADLWRVSAWIEPEGTELARCEEGAGNRCPPPFTPLVDAMVLFAPEGNTSVSLTLDAAPQD